MTTFTTQFHRELYGSDDEGGRSRSPRHSISDRIRNAALPKDLVEHLDKVIPQFRSVLQHYTKVRKRITQIEGDLATLGAGGFRAEYHHANVR